MQSDRLDGIRSWAQRNEPLLRLAEVILVLVFGTAVTISLSVKQNQLAEAQLQLAQAQVPPNLDVSGGSGHDGATLQVFTRRKDVSDLKAYPTVCLELKRDDGTIRRIEIKNFYSGAEQGSTFAWTELSCSAKANYMAITKFHISPDAEHYSEEFIKAYDDPTRKVVCYLGVGYTNAVGEDVFTRIAVDYPMQNLRPIDREPSFDATIDLDKFPGDNFTGFFAQLTALMGDGTK